MYMVHKRKYAISLDLSILEITLSLYTAINQKIAYYSAKTTSWLEIEHNRMCRFYWVSPHTGG